MINRLKNIKFVLILSLIAVLCFATFSVMKTPSVSADAVNTTFAMQQTAEARLKEDSGVRFKVDIGDKLVADIKAQADAKFGFLVAPADLFDGVTDNYHTNLTKKVDIAFSAQDIANKIYVDEDDATLYHANGALVNVKDANYDLKFTAVAYYSLDGVNYVYADRTATPVERSINQLAKATYFDYETFGADLADTQEQVVTYLKAATVANPISISSTQDFDAMVNYARDNDNFILDSDIDFGSQTLESTTKYSAFNVNLDGNGKIISYNFSAPNYFGQGMFTYFNGSMKNVYIDGTFSSPTTYGAQGVIAEVFNGKIQDAVIEVAPKYGSNYGTLFKTMGANACLEDCAITQTVSQCLFAKTAESTATVKNIAYRTPQNGFNFRMPDTVINAENIYLYGTDSEFVSGSVYYSLDNDAYAQTAKANGGDTYDTTNWTNTVKQKSTKEACGFSIFGEISKLWETVEISTADDLFAAFNDAQLKNFVLTAPISIGSADSNYKVLDANESAFSTFNGYLHGNGHKVSMFIDNTNAFGVGAFSKFNGKMENTEVELSYNSTYQGKVQGALANNFNGVIDNCIITCTTTVGAGGKQGLFGAMGANASLTNSLINLSADNAYKLFGYTVEATATVQNIAYIVKGISFKYPLPSAVAPGIKDVVTYLSITNAENGVGYYKVDNNLYPTSSTPNGSSAYDTVNWLSANSAPLTDVLTKITVENGVAKFVTNN